MKDCGKQILDLLDEHSRVHDPIRISRQMVSLARDAIRLSLSDGYVTEKAKRVIHAAPDIDRPRKGEAARQEVRENAGRIADVWAPNPELFEKRLRGESDEE